MDTQELRIKQREALENAHGNFVEPHINQIIAVNLNPLPNISPTPYGFYCVSGWLLLVLVFYSWLHYYRGR